MSILEPTPEIIAALAAQCPTLAWLIRIERRDGLVQGFGTHDLDIDLMGVTFRARSAFSPTTADHTPDLSVDNTEIAGSLSSDALSADDLSAGLYDGARVIQYVTDWSTLAWVLPQATYIVGRVEWDTDGRYKLMLEGLKSLFQTQLGRSTGPLCGTWFGSGKCGVNLAPLTVSGTVASTDGAFFVEAPAAAGFSAGRFTHGVLTFTSGANAGKSARIRSHDGGNIVLWRMLPRVIQPGDEFTLVPGCARTEAACKGWNNFINFRGFPHLSGSDLVSQYPDAKPV